MKAITACTASSKAAVPATTAKGIANVAGLARGIGLGAYGKPQLELHAVVAGDGGLALELLSEARDQTRAKGHARPDGTSAMPRLRCPRW